MKLQESKAGFILSGTAERDLSRNTFDAYIGIDPDVSASGFAVWKKKEKQLIICEKWAFFELYNRLRYWRMLCDKDVSVVVHIEGSWLRDKSNWHEQNNKSSFTQKEKATGERIAKNVGANHQIGKLIVEGCILLDLSFVVREPCTPMFKDENYFKRVTKFIGRTNADARSAANYVYGF